jgi:hypothetical protein
LRSCINTLQMLATRCDHITLPFMQGALERAKKEGSLTVQTVVEGIFAKRMAKERRRLNVMSESEGRRVVNDVFACGEFEGIIRGTSSHFGIIG